MSITQRAFSEVSASISISNMSEHDLLEVVEIEEHSGLSRWGWAAYYAELQSSNCNLLLVARVMRPLEQHRTDNLAGYIVARLSAGELHINNVAVRDEYRRRGIGSALVNRILEEGRQAHASAALLEVRAGNSVAQALYERCGFGVIAQRRNYYAEPTEDALIMSAPLNQDA